MVFKLVKSKGESNAPLFKTLKKSAIHRIFRFARYEVRDEISGREYVFDYKLFILFRKRLLTREPSSC